jgi:hypothetical protein
MPTGDPFHQESEIPFIIPGIDDQMNVVGHQTIRIYSTTIGIFPLLQVIEVIQKIPVRSKHGLPVMSALDNVVGVSRYDYSRRSGHVGLIIQRDLKINNKSVPFYAKCIVA